MAQMPQETNKRWRSATTLPWYMTKRSNCGKETNKNVLSSTVKAPEAQRASGGKSRG